MDSLWRTPDGTRSADTESTLNTTRTHHFRQPETKNRKDFWHVKEDQWNQWSSASEDRSDPLRKSASNNLCKFDAAGRIIETEEGTEGDYTV